MYRDSVAGVVRKLVVDEEGNTGNRAGSAHISKEIARLADCACRPSDAACVFSACTLFCGEDSLLRLSRRLNVACFITPCV